MRCHFPPGLERDAWEETGASGHWTEEPAARMGCRLLEIEMQVQLQVRDAWISPRGADAVEHED